MAKKRPSKSLKSSNYNPRKNVMFKESDWLLLLEVQANGFKIYGEKQTISFLIRKALRHTYENPEGQLVKEREILLSKLLLINNRLKKLGVYEKVIEEYAESLE